MATHRVRYSRPVLTWVFLLGAGSSVLGIAGSIVLLVSDPKTEQIGLLGLAVNAAGCVACLAFAALLDYASRAAHYAEQTYLSVSAQPPRPIKTAIPVPAAVPPPEDVICPNCLSVLDVRTIVRGPNTCPHCRRTFTAS